MPHRVPAVGPGFGLCWGAGHLLVVHSEVAPHIVVLPVEVVHLSSIG